MEMLEYLSHTELAVTESKILNLDLESYPRPDRPCI